MLYYFFDNKYKDTEILFRDKKIRHAGEYYSNLQGKYPVIFITLKDVKVNNWQFCLEHIKSVISNLYKEHNYLLESDLLDISDKELFNDIINQTANQIKYENSLKQLSKYLYDFHKQNVIILLDEYDTPIHTGYHYGYYEDIITFMRNFISGAFKDNKYLYKGVITGILRISRESLFSGANNIGIYTILDYDFSAQFGFTETETHDILKYFNLENNYKNVKNWYNGYIFGDVENIYNPWSIASFIATYKQGFQPHWVNTGSDDLIKKRTHERDANYIRENIEELIKGDTIQKIIDKNIVFPDLDSNKELLWSLLTFSGYLIPVKNVKGDLYKLRVPNYEIKVCFQKIILNWLNISLKIRSSLLYEMAENLINNKMAEFERNFKAIMGDTFSYFDISSEPERVYQSYTLGLLTILSDDYIIKSNRESGEGRYDILLLPYDKNKNGIVIEIKTLKKNAGRELINKTLNHALKQITNNKYFIELKQAKISTCIEIALVFAGKNIYLISDTINLVRNA